VGYGQLGVGIAPVLLAAFFLWFFRDPQRTIPAGSRPDCVARRRAGDRDGTISTPEGPRQRISIFLSVLMYT
jgi:phosphatidylserine decarboxylase